LTRQLVAQAIGNGHAAVEHCQRESSRLDEFAAIEGVDFEEFGRGATAYV
jgi:hypothetical protein